MSKLSEVVNQLQMGSAAISSVLSKRINAAKTREDAEMIRQMADNARDAANLLSDVLEGVQAMEEAPSRPPVAKIPVVKEPRQTVAEMLRGQMMGAKPEAESWAEPESDVPDEVEQGPDALLGQQAIDAIVAHHEAKKALDEKMSRWRVASSALNSAKAGAKRAAQAEYEAAAEALYEAQGALEEAEAAKQFVLDSSNRPL